MRRGLRPGAQDANTRAVSSALLKRAGEPRQPGRMLIRRRQVLLIEPARAGSQIAGLIAGQGG